MVASKELLPGQFFNWFSPEFEGTVLFIIGSLFFAMAAYVNGLSQRTFDTPIEKMFTAATTCYMIGALLLVMGSGAWLWKSHGRVRRCDVRYRESILRDRWSDKLDSD